MRRTSWVVLLLLGLFGGVAGFLLDAGLTAAGRPTFTPVLALPILFVVLAAVLIAFAVPIARAKRGTSRVPVNPFRAMRVALLAQASSLVGALSAGFALGLGVYLATRPISPQLGSLGAVVATIAAGLILVGAALVAEYLCTIRKDDDDEHAGSAGGPDPRR